MSQNETQAKDELQPEENKNHKKDKKKHHEDELQQKLEKLEAEKLELHDMLLRKAAEFDNYRKRTLKEKEEYRVTANRELVSAILPVLDNFDRGIKSSEESRNFDALMEGIKMVHQQIHNLFETYHVKPIECVNQEFDPNLHEALMIEEREDLPFDSTVVEEFERGYMMGEAVLRHAKVKVAKKIKKDNERG